MLIYISGPISGISNYKENFLKTKKMLEGKGFEVLSVLDVPCLEKRLFYLVRLYEICLRFT